ncbi:MAG: metal-dependent transcriptional regulator [Candidatus Anstonellaceae archaeon]
MSNASDRYLLAIDELLQERLVAKTSTLAKKLNVKPSSVLEMILKLQKEELVIYQPYVGVNFTKKGKEKVRQIKQRTNIFFEFLKKIGVPEKFAYNDSKAIESMLSPITLKQMQQFLYFVGIFNKNHNQKPCFFDYFEKYLKSGKIKKNLSCCALANYSSFNSKQSKKSNKKP